MQLATTQEMISELRLGRMIILVDDEERENEGDLVLAAEFVDAEAINFMARFGRGLICLTLTDERCQQLGLPAMVARNETQYETNFTVSIEAAQGVTTGISAADRATTIQAAIARNAKPSDLVQPGHIFPLRAKQGGVLVRAGHTEAGCDLARLAGLMPASVICEIMKDDGTMARLPDLLEFAKTHQLKVGTIADLIAYRHQTESIIERMGVHTMHTVAGSFTAYAYRDLPTNGMHLALTHGRAVPGQTSCVRVHQPFSVFDILETQMSTHSWHIHEALHAIKKAEHGVVVLLNCESSSEQLLGQLNSLYQPLQHTKEPMNLRTYGIGAQILKDLGVEKMHLLGNPRKMPSMAGFDLTVTGYQVHP